MLAFCAFTVFIEPRDDTTCFSNSSDVTGTVEMGLPAFILSLNVDDVKGPKSEHQLTICQCIHLQLFLTALESIKLFSSKFDFYSSCFQGALLWVNEVTHTPSGIRNQQIGFTCCSLAFRYCFHVTGSVTPQTFITKPTYNTPKCLLRLFFP